MTIPLADITVLKVNTWSVKLQYKGETYTLNRFGVFCLHNDHGGKIIYNIGGKLNDFSLRETNELVEHFKKSGEYSARYSCFVNLYK